MLSISFILFAELIEKSLYKFLKSLNLSDIEFLHYLLCMGLGFVDLYSRFQILI